LKNEDNKVLLTATVFLVFVNKILKKQDMKFFIGNVFLVAVNRLTINKLWQLQRKHGVVVCCYNVAIIAQF